MELIRNPIVIDDTSIKLLKIRVYVINHATRKFDIEDYDF